MPSAEHQRYRRMGFEPHVPSELFGEDEIEMLRTYGSWLAALMGGRIEPESPDQEHFVKVCKGEVEPQTQFERVWVRYVKRKLWEAENPDYVGLENTVFADLGITGKGWGIYGHFR
jgi:uncharacterized protein YifE (UPF0438 family)